MLHTPRRRLSLSDAAIVIAAIALGLVPARYVVALDLPSIKLSPSDATARLTRILTAGMTLASPVLIALSLAAFVISLRQPRPPLRSLAREPGFVAMAVIVMTTGYHLLHYAVKVTVCYHSTSSSSLLLPVYYVGLLTNIFLESGWNVAVAWSVLALQGNWRRRSRWNGGLGVALGCTWVAIRASYDLYQILRMIYVQIFT
jgi:hypothetical protein